MTPRSPTGGYFVYRTIASAWARLSTRGIISPIAPASSGRLRRDRCVSGTRTRAGRPMVEETWSSVATVSMPKLACSVSIRM
jgi:hypothetical protein